MEFHESFFEVVRAAFAATVESRDFADPATLAEINDAHGHEGGDRMLALAGRLLREQLLV